MAGRTGATVSYKTVQLVVWVRRALGDMRTVQVFRYLESSAVLCQYTGPVVHASLNSQYIETHNRGQLRDIGSYRQLSRGFGFITVATRHLERLGVSVYIIQKPFLGNCKLRTYVLV